MDTTKRYSHLKIGDYVILDVESHTWLTEKISDARYGKVTRIDGNETIYAKFGEREYIFSYTKLKKISKKEAMARMI